MAIDGYADFAERAIDKVGRYNREFTLSPQTMTQNEFAVDELDWDSVRFGTEELDRIPDDKRGVYAFSICALSKHLPPHGYILYIGIAGRRSDRSLRERYRDYLNAKKNVKDRPGVAFMIGNWGSVLRFFFAPIGDELSTDDLQTLEKQLNSALMPPFSRNDLDAGLREMRRAFP